MAGIAQREPTCVDHFLLYSRLEIVAQKATSGQGVDGTSLRFSADHVNAALLAQGIRQEDLLTARQNAVQQGLIAEQGAAYGLTRQGLAYYNAVCRRI